MQSNHRSTCDLGGVGFSRLDESQCQQLHWATLEVLERTGVRLYESAAVELLGDAGAIVTDGNLVRIPSGMVQKALGTAPKRAVLCDRHGNRVLQLQGRRSYYGPGSDALYIVDRQTGERRPAVLKDVEEGILLSDALPNVDFVMSMFLPSDVDQTLYELYQMEVMLSNTTKPIIIVTHDLHSLQCCVEMAEVVVGGGAALRRNPCVTCYINVTTGQRHNAEALQKLIYLAEKGLPSIYVPVCYGGLTAPVTLAGSVAATNAGVLVGVVISQLVREGAPIVVPGWGARTINMRNGAIAYFTPDDKGLMPAMAHYYGLPMFGYGGFSDSKCLDGQASLEAATSLTLATLTGAHLVHDMGYLEAGLSGALEQLVICDEVIEWLSHAFAPVPITEETLALEVIDRLGPDGNYLDDDHTLDHFRERWVPGLLDQSTHDIWLEAGGKCLFESARDRVEAVLGSHRPYPLPEAAKAAVHAILEREIARIS